MNSQRLRNLATHHNLSRADLASKANVSRAAVTRWFSHINDGWINMETDTLRELAKNLGVSPATLLEDQLPLLPLQTQFLWDGLFPSMEAFLKALVSFDLSAIARLVQVLGFYCAKRLLGRKTITAFPKYKRLIKPVRRKELELLWELYL